MLTPLEEIGIRTAGRVAEEAAVLPFHTILRISSLLFLGFALFFLIMRLERKARQAFVRATAPKTGHYAFLAGMILILIPVWTGRESGIRGILIPVLITLLFLAAGAALLFWRRIGLYLALVYLWTALPGKELSALAVTETDRVSLSLYSPAGMMGVYAADRYLLDRASALALAAFCLTVWAAFYYGRRRLLFREEEKRICSGLSGCVRCASPLIGEGSFCPVCGADNGDRARSVTRKEPLDNMRYCPDCGGLLRDGNCTACRARKRFSEILKEDVKEGARKGGLSLLKKILAVVLTALVLFAPLAAPDPLSRMTEGSGRIAGEITVLYKEWEEAPALSDDGAFRSRFGDAVSSFTERLVSGLDFDGTGRLTYAELYGYIVYLDAAWKEAAVLDAMGKAVNAGDAAEAKDLGNAFNRAEDARTAALAGGLRLAVAAGQDGYLTRIERTVVDSLRFYLSFVSPYILTGISAVLTLAAVILTFIFRKKDPDPDPFGTREEEIPDEDLTASRREGEKAAKKERLLLAVVGFLTAVLILGGILFESAQNAGKPPKVSAVFRDAYYTEGALLLEKLALPEEEAGTAGLSEAIGAFREKLSLLETGDVTGEDGETLREYRDIAERTDRALALLEEELACGKAPDSGILSETAGLIAEGMKAGLEPAIADALSAASDLVD